MHHPLSTSLSNWWSIEPAPCQSSKLHRGSFPFTFYAASVIQLDLHRPLNFFLFHDHFCSHMMNYQKTFTFASYCNVKSVSKSREMHSPDYIASWKLAVKKCFMMVYSPSRQTSQRREATSNWLKTSALEMKKMVDAMVDSCVPSPIARELLVQLW